MAVDPLVASFQDEALTWKLTAQAAERAYERLHDAAFTYLTIPNKKTLKALWRELDFGLPPAQRDGQVAP